MLSLALVAVITLVDSAVSWGNLSFTVRGLLDEPLHLLTAVATLGAVTRWRHRLPSPAFTWSLLIASVAIDVDHLPAELSHSEWFYGNLPRPYTHALWLLALLILIAVAAWLRARNRPDSRPRAALIASVFAGISWGVATHFLRDLVTAPIALWWPISSAWIRIPYWWYFAALILFAVLPVPLPPRLRRIGR